MRASLAAIIAGPPAAGTLDFAEHLSRLALHYWRPEFTPHEAARLNKDYMEDLQGVTVDELIAACRAYRSNPRNRFYPTTGQLLELAGDGLKERKRQRVGAEAILTMLDRPALPPPPLATATFMERLAKKLRIPTRQAAPAPVPLQMRTAFAGRNATDVSELVTNLQKRKGA